MKELLRSVLFREYNRNLKDYLQAIEFSAEEADAYVEFANLSMERDIKMEQIYVREVPRALKENPGLAKELLKYKDDLMELEVIYGRLIDEDFKVIKSQTVQGLYSIILNHY